MPAPRAGAACRRRSRLFTATTPRRCAARDARRTRLDPRRPARGRGRSPGRASARPSCWIVTRRPLSGPRQWRRELHHGGATADRLRHRAHEQSVRRGRGGGRPTRVRRRSTRLDSRRDRDGRATRQGGGGVGQPEFGDRGGVAASDPAQLAQRVGEVGGRGPVAAAVAVDRPVGGVSQPHADDEQVLLRAVVQVALERPPGAVGGVRGSGARVVHLGDQRSAPARAGPASRAPRRPTE